MAVSTETTVLDHTDSLTSTKIESFPIPGRLVHGRSFPLAIRPKEGVQFEDIKVAAEHLQTLAKAGVFDSLLSQRAQPRH